MNASHEIKEGRGIEWLPGLLGSIAFWVDARLTALPLLDVFHLPLSHVTEASMQFTCFLTYPSVYCGTTVQRVLDSSLNICTAIS